MNPPPETDRDKALGTIAKELKIIRCLLTTLLIGLAAVLVNPQLAVVIAIVGLAFWLLIIVAASIFNRATRKREERIRFRELSGR